MNKRAERPILFFIEEVQVAFLDQAEEALKKSEEDAKEIYDKNAILRVEIQNLEAKLEKAQKETHQARCELSNSNAAYERQKRRIDELIETRDGLKAKLLVQRDSRNFSIKVILMV